MVKANSEENSISIAKLKYAQVKNVLIIKYLFTNITNYYSYSSCKSRFHLVSYYMILCNLKIVTNDIYPF